MAKEYRQNANWCEEDHPREPAGNSKGGQFAKKIGGSQVSKQQWARFYEKIGEIKRNYFVATDEEGNWYIHVDNLLFIAMPKYENPKCKEIYKFSTEQALLDYLKEWDKI